MKRPKIDKVEASAIRLERERLQQDNEAFPRMRNDGGARVRRRRGTAVAKIDIVLSSDVDPLTGCWIWKRSTARNGYGRVGEGGRVLNAHAVSLALWHGRPNSPALKGLHKCDKPNCVNPSHLYWGTQSDNNMDAVSRGRFNRPTGDRWHDRKTSRRYAGRH